MTDQVAAVFLSANIDAFAANKRLADRAIAQVDDSHLHKPLNDNTNSIAVIMKHVAGNLTSRWTDFLTRDGEKLDRYRDEEFVDRFANRNEIIDCWESGWRCLFDSLAKLSIEDLSSTVVIRGQIHSVPQAMQRSLGHTCYHIGQIVMIARIHARDDWTTLTIPKGQSQQYNEENWGQSGRSHS